MPRHPVQTRAHERRESLLDAVATILARDGYPAVNTNAIAAEAGAAVGTVYDYFPNKEAVLVALLARYQERLQHAVFGAVSQAEGDVEALVEAGVRGFARFYVEEPGYAELWLGSQLVEPLAAAGQAWGRAFAEAMGSLLQQSAGLPPKRAERIALTLVHAVSSVVTLAVRQPRRQREALVHEAVVLAQAYVTRASEPG